MVASVRVVLIAHPGNGYWQLLRRLLRAHKEVLVVGDPPCADEALAQLAALPLPPDLVLASPLVPSSSATTDPTRFPRALAAVCPPARVALFGHSYDAALDRLRWDLGMPSYLCWDELMTDAAAAPRRLAAVLGALLAGVPVQTERARLAGRPSGVVSGRLSRAERGVLLGLVQGWTHAEIAHALRAQGGQGSPRQVERLLKALQERYGVASSYAVLLRAVADGDLALTAGPQPADRADGIPPAGGIAPTAGTTSPLILAQARQVLAENPLS